MQQFKGRTTTTALFFMHWSTRNIANRVLAVWDRQNSNQKVMKTSKFKN